MPLPPADQATYRQRAQENEMIKQTQLVEFLEQPEMKIQHSSDTCGPFSFVTKF